MKQHSFLSHTPEEMRQLSNLGHIIEGTLFAIVGLLALLLIYLGLEFAILRRV